MTSGVRKERTWALFLQFSIEEMSHRKQDRAFGRRQEERLQDASRVLRPCCFINYWIVSIAKHNHMGKAAFPVFPQQLIGFNVPGVKFIILMYSIAVFRLSSLPQCILLQILAKVGSVRGGDRNGGVWAHKLSTLLNNFFRIPFLLQEWRLV